MTDEEKVIEEQMRMEYSFLRKEIDDLISLHNTLLTFTITASLAVVTVAASEGIWFMYLFPICIIIPMAIRIADYRVSIVKLAAYLRVFLEPELPGVFWETRKSKFDSSCYFKSKLTRKLKNSEVLVLSVFCYTLYFLNHPNVMVFPWDSMTALSILGPLALLVWLGHITIGSQIKIKKAEKEDVFKKEWDSIKLRELAVSVPDDLSAEKTKK